jgi:hypothetical protein
MRWVALLTLTLVSIWLLLRFVGTATAALSYPFPHEYSEGRTLHEVLLVKRGTPVYDAITAERYIAGSSPPLQYWIAAPLVSAEPPNFSQAEDVPSVFAGPRTLSFLAALVAASAVVVLALLSRGHSRKKGGGWTAIVWAAIGGALFLSLPPVLVWSARLEAEIPAVALTAVGLICVAAAARKQAHLTTDRKETEGRSGLRAPFWLLLLAALLFTLAFYTNQTAVAGPIAAAAYLLLRDLRGGLRWTGIMALALGLPFVVMEAITGHWFYLKLFTYNSLPARRAGLEAILGGFWEDAWPLLILATGYVTYRLLRVVGQYREDSRDLQRLETTQPLLLPIFTVVSLLLIPYVLTFRPGHNALLMPALGVCACAGALSLRLFAAHGEADVRMLEGTEAERGSWGIGAWLGDAVLVLVAIYAVLTSPPAALYTSELSNAANEGERLRLIVANAQANSGPELFSDDPGLVALAGKETPYNDPRAMTHNAQAGRWDETAYREKLRGGAFSMVLLSCDPTASLRRCRAGNFTPGVLDALQSGYRVLFQDFFFTLVPR